jgi:hypothetical protein
MPVSFRNSWRIAVICSMVLGASVLPSLGLSYASSTQLEASQQVFAQVATPTLKQINSDPFTNTTSNHKTQVEPGSFSFGNTIVTAMQSGRFFDGGASDISFSTSQDGGKTWISGALPGVTTFSTPAGPYARASDPSVAFDARHNVWLISYLGIKTLDDVDVDVSRSTDGGRTWSNPIIVSATGDSLDKNWSTCDNSRSSRFFGNCYTEFDDNTDLNLVQLSTSSNGGLTWGAPATTPMGDCVIGGQPLVQPNGRLIMPISDCIEFSVLSINSNDGGRTLSQPSFISQQIFFGAAPPSNLRSGGLVSADIDREGTVYVTWADCRAEARCTNGEDDLMLSTSDDGTNWSVPRRIPIAPLGSTVNPMLPGLGVDHNTGGNSAHLGLMYYFYPNQTDPGHNTFCDVDTCQLEVGFISSSNGGRTWSAPQTLAGPMKLRWLPLTTQGFMVGDYFATSFVSSGDRDRSDDDHGQSDNRGESLAFPMFMVASAPTAPDTTCSNDTTGAPGQHCNQPTFTVANGIPVGRAHEGDRDAETAAEASARGSSTAAIHLQLPEQRTRKDHKSAN